MKKLLILILACLLLACESNRVYEQNNTLDSRYWRVDDPQIFTFEIKDNAAPYNIYYNIRNSLDYPVARLFVEYTLADSGGVELKKNLTAEYLFDQKTGKPFGESGIGDVFDHQFKIIDKHQFPYAGKYQLTLKQFNRVDTLMGILAVGVRVETIPTE
jgi:gliding motility-associated lipoprotein GldH